MKRLSTRDIEKEMRKAQRRAPHIKIPQEPNRDQQFLVFYQNEGQNIKPNPAEAKRLHQIQVIAYDRQDAELLAIERLRQYNIRAHIRRTERLKVA